MSEEMLNEEIMVESLQEAAETSAEPKQEAVETMADYDEAITASLKPIHEGDILTGTIIGVSEEELTVDLGI